MTTTVEYLDAIKAKTGLPSDYAVAKLLNVTRPCVSRYRNGLAFFDDEIALKVASILEIPEIEVILNVHAERSTNPLIKASFASVLQRIGSVAATLLLATSFSLANPSPANAGAGSSVVEGALDGVYYVKSRLRRKSRKNAKIDLSFMVRQLLKSA